MEKNNMTAVEWLVKIYLQTKKIDSFDIEQAKQMEKEQMIDFAEKYSFNLTSTSAEGFYNETYGKE